jgi:hypothetical protein
MSQPGIPTTYNGTTFRSRLEARWAYLFDGLGLHWEYEPFDANGYIPDFVLPGGRPLLIEVKPDPDTGSLQQYIPKISGALTDVWSHDVLIVGMSPILIPQGNGEFWGYPTAGLLGEFNHDSGAWCWDDGLWHTCLDCKQVGVFHSLMWFIGRPCGHSEGDHLLGHVDESDIGRLWADARNITRWQPASPADLAWIDGRRRR